MRRQQPGVSSMGFMGSRNYASSPTPMVTQELQYSRTLSAWFRQGFQAAEHYMDYMSTDESAPGVDDVIDFIEMIWMSALERKAQFGVFVDQQESSKNKKEMMKGVRAWFEDQRELSPEQLKSMREIPFDCNRINFDDFLSEYETQLKRLERDKPVDISHLEPPKNEISLLDSDEGDPWFRQGFQATEYYMNYMMRHGCIPTLPEAIIFFDAILIGAEYIDYENQQQLMNGLHAWFEERGELRPDQKILIHLKPCYFDPNLLNFLEDYKEKLKNLALPGRVCVDIPAVIRNTETMSGMAVRENGSAQTSFGSVEAGFPAVIPLDPDEFRFDDSSCEDVAYPSNWV